MIIKCPNCNGALEYDAAQGLLYCKFCGNFFTAEEVAMPETDPAEEAAPYQPTKEVYNEANNYGRDLFVPEAAVDTFRPQKGFSAAIYDSFVNEGFTQYDSIAGMKEDAREARASGVTGNIAYDISKSDRDQNRNSYYEEQMRLHEQYEARPKADYSKPFAGTSRENMTDEQRKAANIADELERKQRRNSLNKMYETNLMMKYSGNPEFESMAAVGNAVNINPAQEIVGTVATAFGSQSTINAVKAAGGLREDGLVGADLNSANLKLNKIGKETRYTATGARILNSMHMYVTTDAREEQGQFTMDNNIYTCTTCGAELAVNGVETSSFCAYCGQPTIVFNRMEKTTMPDHIIPFVITKDQALTGIRDKLSKGFLMPPELKNFEVERLRGIYIPYWLFDAEYQDSMLIRTRVKSGKTTVTKYYRVNTGCDLYYYPVDASRNLNDNLSKKLEPYDYSGIRPFNPAYMSGFYADRFDMDADTMTMTSMYRAQYLMYERAKRSVPGTPSGLVDSYPVYHVKKQYYTLLPAWFMTLRYEGIPYTILVNGQNGKVVGAVPYSKKKFYGLFAGVFTAASCACVPLGIAIIPAILQSGSNNSSSAAKVIVFFIVMIAALYMIAYGNYQSYLKSMKLSSEDKITNFVRERQDM